MSGAGNPPSQRWRTFADLPWADRGPVIRARLRERPEDFVVDELLGFAPDGDGEHLLLRVRKTGANTDWTARRLAQLAGVHVRSVGYAGLKDRHAVTTQWLSVPLGPRPVPDWAPLAADGIEVLECYRHRRKLRRGALAGNRFVLRLRDVSGDLDAFGRLIERVAGQGVPNYFGPQRFGYDDGNLHRAESLFRGAAEAARQACGGASAGTTPRRAPGRQRDRHLTGLVLSAVRSQLFNELLALRVQRGDWRTALPGDRLQLRGSHSHFLAEVVDETLAARVATGDCLPTGPLFGAGELPTSGEPAELEARVAAAFPDWVDGLAAAGLRQERRPLAVVPGDLTVEHPAPTEALLRFTLPPGSYATTILRGSGLAL
jgi:tRNA pseudouridine13 synthase